MKDAGIVSVIDDDPSLLKAVVGLVRSFGFSAEGFASAEHLLAAGRQHASACIIADIHMPGMSGIDLARILEEGGVHTPVIFITARTEQALIERAKEMGSVAVLRKPFDEDELLRCIEQALLR